MSSVAPDRRLLAAVALWVALGVAAVAAPVLWPVAVGAALLLVAVLARDVRDDDGDSSERRQKNQGAP